MVTTIVERLCLLGKHKVRKNSLLEDLRHEYPAVSTSVLKNIINNSLVPRNILKLSSEFEGGRVDKEKEEDCKSGQDLLT